MTLLIHKFTKLIIPTYFNSSAFGISCMLIIPHETYHEWSKTSLSYWMMVERYPNLKEEVGGSILGCEVFSLPDGKLARWSTTSCALALACRRFVSKLKN